MKQKTGLMKEVLPILYNLKPSNDDGLSLALKPCCTPLTQREYQKRGLVINSLVICLICCLVMPVSGQSLATKPEKISIGQTLPDLTFNNSSLQTAKVNELLELDKVIIEQKALFFKH